MRLLFFILFVLAEALIIGRLTEAFGLGPIFIWLFGSAALGVMLIKRQGLRTVQAVQAAQARGELPAINMLEALLSFIGGVLLVIPGLISDLLALLILLGPTRRRLAARVDSTVQQRNPHLRRPVIIEGEFSEPEAPPRDQLR
jgi:UPF0716 protein FxsA